MLKAGEKGKLRQKAGAELVDYLGTRPATRGHRRVVIVCGASNSTRIAALSWSLGGVEGSK